MQFIYFLSNKRNPLKFPPLASFLPTQSARKREKKGSNISRSKQKKRNRNEQLSHDSKSQAQEPKTLIRRKAERLKSPRGMVTTFA